MVRLSDSNRGPWETGKDGCSMYGVGLHVKWAHGIFGPVELYIIMLYLHVSAFWIRWGPQASGLLPTGWARFYKSWHCSHACPPVEVGHEAVGPTHAWVQAIGHLSFPNKPTFQIQQMGMAYFFLITVLFIERALLIHWWGALLKSNILSLCIAMRISLHWNMGPPSYWLLCVKQIILTPFHFNYIFCLSAHD